MVSNVKCVNVMIVCYRCGDTTLDTDTCMVCGAPRRLTREEYLERARQERSVLIEEGVERHRKWRESMGLCTDSLV